MNITVLRHLLLIAEGCRLGYPAIDMLSDDVLLCVFNAYRQKISYPREFLISNGWGRAYMAVV